MNAHKEIILVSTAAVSFAGFVGTAIYAHINAKRLKRLSDRFGVAIDHIVDETDIQIPQEIMDRAMNEAVKKAAKNQVEVSAVTISATIQNDMKRTLREKVEDCTKNLEDDIKAEYRKQIKNLDLDDIRSEVVAEVREKALKMIKSNMDDIIEKHNDELDATARVYESLKEKFDL